MLSLFIFGAVRAAPWQRGGRGAPWSHVLGGRRRLAQAGMTRRPEHVDDAVLLLQALFPLPASRPLGPVDTDRQARTTLGLRRPAPIKP